MLKPHDVNLRIHRSDGSDEKQTVRAFPGMSHAEVCMMIFGGFGCARGTRVFGRQAECLRNRENLVPGGSQVCLRTRSGIKVLHHHAALVSVSVTVRVIVASPT